MGSEVLEVWGSEVLEVWYWSSDVTNKIAYESWDMGWGQVTW